MTRSMFGYVRVSTVKQGTQGVSLQAQRTAIEQYAIRNQMVISEWFQETETAAKGGRPVFTKMMKQLRSRKAGGIVLHKIDRGARNLRDWADLADLADIGVEVHFAGDSLDMTSRGGRLSADIQAVVAADYIRNLREETRKGIQGRLRQGLYPWPAPIGYVDTGRGNVKAICPEQGQKVAEVFRLYATGAYTLETLRDEMFRRGLRNRANKMVSKTGIATILGNPFYTGVIHIARTGETYPGAHLPLVSQSLFDAVQAKLEDRSQVKGKNHDYRYRLFLRCAVCNRCLIGETQKGIVYYRCHTKACRGTSVRQAEVDEHVAECYRRLSFSESELAEMRTLLGLHRTEWQQNRAAKEAGLKGLLDQCEKRLTVLADAMIDGSLDKMLFQERQHHLVVERNRILAELASLPPHGDPVYEAGLELFKLGNTAKDWHEMANEQERRQLLETLSSNFSVRVKNLELEPRFPFSEALGRPSDLSGCPDPRSNRTLKKIAKAFWEAGLRTILDGVPPLRLKQRP